MRIPPLALARSVRRALAFVALGYATLFVACVAIRATFGFELSWMESGMAAMVGRLQAHQSIYAAPSPAYVPFIYPPLYYVLAHGVAWAAPSLGAFAPMRAVSSASVVATLWLVDRVLDRRAVAWRTRWLLCALLLAFYGRFDFWYDTSRVDSLLMLLTFAFTALLVEGRGARSAIAAGLAAGLAALTKQPAIPLFGACTVVLLIAGRARDRSRVLIAAAVGAATVACVLGALGELSNPWLLYYLFEVPATHAIVPRFLGYGALFVTATMPLFLLAAVCETQATPGRLWALTLGAFTVVMLVLRLKLGATSNFFIPLVPVGLVVVASWLGRGGTGRRSLLLAQFLILLYDPRRAVPVASDWRAAFDLLGSLRRTPGDVFFPQFPGYLAMAGKGAVAHDTAVCDLEALRPDLLGAIEERLKSGRYRAAVPYLPEIERLPSCHLRVPSGQYRAEAPLPRGGAFFEHLYEARLRGLFRYDPRSDAGARSRR